MSKVIDTREGGGELVVLGRAVVLPASNSDGAAQPLDGSIRFNPDTNIVEVYVLGGWGPVATAPDGQPMTFSITNVVGLTAALASKAALVHQHVFADIGGLQSALDGKAPLVHTHQFGDVAGLDAEVTNLLGQINTLSTTKAALVHNHAIGDVTGLQDALDHKSAVGHTHSVNDIGDLASKMFVFQRCIIPVYVAGTLPNGIVYRFVAPSAINIPQNMSTSRGTVTGLPTNTIILNVKVNGMTSGAISISTAGAFSFTTTGPLGIVLVAGDILTIESTAADASVSQLSITLLGANQ